MKYDGKQKLLCVIANSLLKDNLDSHFLLYAKMNWDFFENRHLDNINA